MKDSFKVMKQINRKPNITYAALVPNIRGLMDAKSCGTKEISLFAAASNTFSKKNINCTIDESFQRYREVVAAAKESDIKMRGYVSCVMGCPYEGDVPLTRVAEVARRLYGLGCYEISLGDTIGIGTPGKTYDLIQCVKQEVPISKLAVHCHDTYGQALPNILTALQLGVSIVDSSVSGLGGCPYANGASGNVATEEVIYMLCGLGISCGVDLNKVIEVGKFISVLLGRIPSSKVAIATSKKGSLPFCYVS